MKKWILVLLVALLCLSGCSVHTQKTVFAMDTVMSLQLWGPDSRKAEQALEELIRETENTWSSQKPESIISRLNSGLEAENPLLTQVQALAQRTKGAFDPRLGAVMEAWGFRDQNYTVPDAQQLAQAMEAKKWDLGGAVKGYTGALAVQLLEQMQMSQTLYNLPTFELKLEARYLVHLLRYNHLE